AAAPVCSSVMARPAARASSAATSRCMQTRSIRSGLLSASGSTTDQLYVVLAPRESIERLTSGSHHRAGRTESLSDGVGCSRDEDGLQTATAGRGRGSRWSLRFTVFVALRDLRSAGGRFALMGAVVTLMTLLVVLLSGLTAGLARGSTSAITGLPADHLAFAEPATGQDVSFTESTVTESQWRQWSTVPGVSAADPLGIATTKAASGERTAALAAFGIRSGSGLAPESGKISPGHVVLSTGAADDLNTREGGHVELAGQRLKVAAVSGDA